MREIMACWEKEKLDNVMWAKERKLTVVESEKPKHHIHNPLSRFPAQPSTIELTNAYHYIHSSWLLYLIVGST